MILSLSISNEESRRAFQQLDNICTKLDTPYDKRTYCYISDAECRTTSLVQDRHVRVIFFIFEMNDGSVMGKKSQVLTVLVLLCAKDQWIRFLFKKNTSTYCYISPKKNLLLHF